MAERDLPKSPSSTPQTAPPLSTNEVDLSQQITSETFSSLSFPPKKVPTVELVSVESPYDPVKERRKIDGVSQDNARQDVELACRMHTDPSLLKTIRDDILSQVSSNCLSGEPTLYIDDRPCGTRSLAAVLSNVLQSNKYPQAAAVEAAVQLYLQGAYGNTITPTAFQGIHSFIYVPRTELPRPGIFGDGSFAHGEALAELLQSKNETATIVTSLFESGKIAHLVLWARGMRPSFLQTFISKVAVEARNEGRDGLIGPIDPRQLIDHLLPLLANKLHVEGENRYYQQREDDRIKSQPWPVRLAIRAIEGMLYVALGYAFSDIKARITQQQSELDTFRQPDEFFRLIRSELAHAKVLWDSPPIRFSDLTSHEKNEFHYLTFFKLMPLVQEVAQRQKSTGLPPPGKQYAASFFPQGFFRTSTSIWDRDKLKVPDSPDTLETYSDLIVTDDLGNACAFSTLCLTFEDTYLVKDENDLNAALMALRDKLFAKKYEHSRLKVAVYSRELLSAASDSDCIAALDTFTQSLDDAEIARILTDPNSIERLRFVFQPGEGANVKIRQRARFLDRYGNAGYSDLKASAFAVYHPDTPKDRLSPMLLSKLIRALCTHPLAIAAFVHHLDELTTFGRVRGLLPPAASGRDYGFLSRTIRMVQQVTRVVFAGSLTHMREAIETVQAESLQVRINKPWNNFFGRLESLSMERNLIEMIRGCTTKGVIPTREFQILSDFFQLTSMPCATKFLFLHFRAARLGLHYTLGFPVLGRYILPESGQPVAFPSVQNLSFKNTKEFEQYLKKRTLHIITNQNHFIPENECDLELFALVCRAYRNGIPPNEVTERTLVALLPHLKTRVDGHDLPPGSVTITRSPFDPIIQRENLAMRRMLISPAPGKLSDEFRRTVSRLKEEAADAAQRFDAQRAAVAHVHQIGSSQTIARLEARYGIGNTFSDQDDVNLSYSHHMHSRVLGFVNSLSGNGRSLHLDDAVLLFCAHALRSTDRQGSVSHYLQHKGDLEQWGGLLEYMSEGINDPLWEEVLKAASEPLRAVLKAATDTSHLEHTLLPLLNHKESDKRKPVPVWFALTRGPVSNFIGSICETCASEPLHARSNIAFISFHLGDEDASVVRSLFGGCLLIRTETQSGEPALVIRGFNPQLRLISKTSVHGLYDALLTYVVENVATPLGISTVLAPFEMVSGGAFSNRALIHLAFKSKYRDKRRIIPLCENHGTTYNERSINDLCLRVWPPEAEN